MADGLRFSRTARFPAWSLSMISTQHILSSLPGYHVSYMENGDVMLTFQDRETIRSCTDASEALIRILALCCTDYPTETSAGPMLQVAITGYTNFAPRREQD